MVEVILCACTFKFRLVGYGVVQYREEQWLSCLFCGQRRGKEREYHPEPSVLCGLGPTSFTCIIYMSIIGLVGVIVWVKTVWIITSFEGSLLRVGKTVDQYD